MSFAQAALDSQHKTLRRVVTSITMSWPMRVVSSSFIPGSRSSDKKSLWGLCKYVIIHMILPPSPVILWIWLGDRRKWLPLKMIWIPWRNAHTSHWHGMLNLHHACWFADTQFICTVCCRCVEFRWMKTSVGPTCTVLSLAQWWWVLLPNGGRAHYVIESNVQWQPFWLATQQYPRNDWLGGNLPYTMTYAHGTHLFDHQTTTICLSSTYQLMLPNCNPYQNNSQWRCIWQCSNGNARPQVKCAWKRCQRNLSEKTAANCVISSWSWELNSENDSFPDTCSPCLLTSGEIFWLFSAQLQVTKPCCLQKV